MSNKIKISFIIDHLGVGGAQKQFVHLVTQLPKDRFDVEVITLSDQKFIHSQAIEDLQIPITVISHKFKSSFSTIRQLMNHLRYRRPHIVNTWLFTADFCGTIAAKWAGIPYVISAIRSPAADFPLRQKMTYRMLLPFHHSVTVNAQAVRTNIAKNFWLPERKIHVIANGIEFEREETGADAASLEEWGVPKDAQVILSVARLTEQKDHETLIRAAQHVCAKNPSVYFLLLGDGPARQRLMSLCEELGIEKKIKFLGSQSIIKPFLKASSFFVLSTKYEGCSNAIMEAMLEKMAVVATDVGGNSELVVHGKTGLLVKPYDVANLAKAILTLTENVSLTKKMGEAGYQHLIESFSLPHMVTLYRELFESVVEVTSPRGVQGVLVS